MTMVTCNVCRATVDVPRPLTLFPCACGEVLRTVRRAQAQRPTSPPGTPVDFYQILGLDRSASAAQIKQAYRTRSRQTHPDLGGDAEEFSLVAIANEVLSDPTRRADYDTGKWSDDRSVGPLFEMPDVSGMKSGDAAEMLIAAGLVVFVRLIAVPVKSTIRNRAVGQYPYAGASVSIGNPCEIVVAVSVMSVVLANAKRAAGEAAHRAAEFTGSAIGGFIGAVSQQPVPQAPRELTTRQQSGIEAGQRAADITRTGAGFLSAAAHGGLYLYAGFGVLLVFLLSSQLGWILLVAWVLLVWKMHTLRKRRRAQGKWI